MGNDYWVHHCPAKPATRNDSPAICHDRLAINKKFDKNDVALGDQHFEVFSESGSKSDGIAIVEKF